MRHSIWFTQAGMGTPTGTAGLTGQAPDHDPSLAPKRTTRLWVRSLLAFVAMLLFLASLIELVAAFVVDGHASVPFGVAGVCVAIAIVVTLAMTRERSA